MWANNEKYIFGRWVNSQFDKESARFNLSLPKFAIGKIISILYSPPLDFPLVVIVDFSGCRGPTWIDNFLANETRCNDNWCNRMGFRLMPGYAISITKSLGMSKCNGKIP